MSEIDDFLMGKSRAGRLSSSSEIDVFLNIPAATKQPSRTWGEAAADTGAQLAEGVNNIIGAVPGLISPDAGLSSALRRNADYWRGQQSEGLKSRIKSADTAIDAAGEDGVLAQVSEAAKQYYNDPALAARFVTTNIPSMVPGVAAAKLAQVSALARGASAAQAAGLATTTAGGVNAVLNAGGARGEAYDDIKRALESKGLSSGAASEMAVDESVLPAAVGAVTGFVSGKTGLEKGLVGQVAGKSAARAAAASAGSEMLGEQLEEVAPKITTNYQAEKYDGRSLGKDVGRTIVETAVGTGPGAAVSGGAAYVAHGKGGMAPVAAAEQEASAINVSDLYGTPVGGKDIASAPQTAVVQPARPAEVSNQDFQRLVELELTAEQRPLTPDENAEADRLQAALEQQDAAAAIDQQAPGAVPSEPMADPVTSMQTQSRKVAADDLAPFMAARSDKQLASLAAPSNRAEVRQAAQQEISRREAPVASVQQEASATAAGMLGGNPTQQTAEAAPAQLEPMGMQNRDRGTAASILQMQSIANAPDFDRLGASPIPDVGAPLVSIKDNVDGTILPEEMGQGGEVTLPDGSKVGFRYAVLDADRVQASHDATGAINPGYTDAPAGTVVALNNGRTAGLKAAYAAGSATQPGGYRDRLTREAQSFGIAPQAVTSKANPVLVRVYDDAVNARPDIARQANSGGSMGMSAQEVARNDAAMLPDLRNLVVDENGEFDPKANAPFVRGWMNGLPQGDQAQVTDRGGNLSQVGATRLRNAIIAKAYGDNSVFGRLVESLDDNMRNVGRALVRAAPKIAQVRELIAAGAAHDLDIGDDINRAVDELVKMRQEGVSLADFLAQASLFAEQKTAPETLEILAFLDANLRSPNRIADFLSGYYAQVEAMGSPNQGDMFGAPQVGRSDLIRNAKAAALPAAKVVNEVNNDRRDEPGGASGRGPEEAGAPIADAAGIARGEVAPAVSGADGAGGEIGQKREGAASGYVESGPVGVAAAGEPKTAIGKEARKLKQKQVAKQKKPTAPKVSPAENAPKEIELTGQTNEEAAADLARQKATREQEAADKLAAEQKVKADAEANDFRLAGSDRPADVAMAGGQTGLFVANGQPTKEAKAEQADTAPAAKVEPANGEFKKAKVENSAGKKVDGYRAEFDNKNGGTGYIELAVDGKRIYPVMVDNGRFRADEGSSGAVREIYEKAIAFAAENGLNFTSDDSVTASAARIYDSLSKRGYSVEKNPKARMATPPEVITDRLVTDDGVPVFTVLPVRANKPKAEPAKPQAAANTVFTEDAAAKARELLRKKLGQLNSGLDPEMMQAGITLAGYHIEKGARTFAAYAKAMIEDLGDAVKPYLKSWYMGVRYDPRAAGFDGMSSPVEVDSADVDAIVMKQGEQNNVTDQRSGTNLERNRGDAETQNGMGAEGVRPGRDGDGGTGGSGVESAPDARRGERSGERGGEDETATAGESGDQSVYRGAPEPAPGSAGNRVDLGSRDGGIDGLPVEPDAAKAIEKVARSPLSLDVAKVKQAKADKAAPVTPGIESVRAALPILTAGQQEDVVKAEARFSRPDGYGMLFTNGTGTGKTFTGLGIIKRFANAGKTNILIVSPNDEIIGAWQKAGKLLGLDISRLADTADAGKGMVITTYANMGANDALASREWDLVVHDEAHYLAMDKDGTNTNALKALRAITLHPDGAYQRHAMLNRSDIARLADLREKISQAGEYIRSIDTAERLRVKSREKNAQRIEEAETLRKKLLEKEKAIKENVASRQGAARPRVAFLSATPFAYEKTVDWANGYLFDYNEGRGADRPSGTAGRSYNEGDNRAQFMMQHFGYRMRYNKLTEPDARVDRGLMQRQFNGWLKKAGALSGRMLDVEADYDRRFILVDSGIGKRIDDALEWFEARRKEQPAAPMGKIDPYAEALNQARDTIAEKFDYLSRRYLLESIKAREVVPHIREHMAMGRKVVVFHDYKKGGGFNPFLLNKVQGGETQEDQAKADAFNRVVDEFNREFSDIINSDLFKQSSPIDMFKQEFPGVLLFNGDVPAKQRRANVAKFQDDASGPQIILVQSAAGKEGISLHDTTGKHQRVMFNLGQPTQPTTAIQQEGRIYRTGQVTDAIFRYLNTGTRWEQWAFATTIAQRASAAENLGMGEMARALKDAFINGFTESGDYRAGMDGEGKGGKERDRLANEAISEYDRAKAFYFGQQKKTSATKAAEGTDYFATPEPVGLKMVEFADLRPGESALEPSAGHGAIARWIPESVNRTAIEPSMKLRPRLAMVFDGEIIGSDFEDHHVVNKYDAIVMNPPFGSGGKTAVDHLTKAATHLRDGGRIVALLPTGPAADKRLAKWLYGEEERTVKPLFEHPKLGPIYRGDTIKLDGFGGVGTEVVVHHVDDLGGAQYVRPKGADLRKSINLIAATSIEHTGKRTETYRPAGAIQMVADIKLPAGTFERAGTQVMTHIIVLEKQEDAAKASDTRGIYNRDLSGIDSIGDLFDEMENMAMPQRAKEQSAEEAAPPAKPAKAKKEEARQQAMQAEESAAGALASQDKATFALKDGKVVTNAPLREYTTKAGKLLNGVWVPDQKMAKAADAYTWKSRDFDGNYFVRIEHVVRPGAGEGGSRFSRADDRGTIHLEDLNAVAATFRAGFPGVPVVVLEHERQAPDRLLEDIREAGADGTVAGAFHDGTIYLIRDAIRNVEHAEHVILHEGVHGGLRQLFGQDVEPVMLDIWKSNLKLQIAAKKIKDQYGYSQVRSAEEALADMGSAVKKLNGWKRLVAWVRSKLRSAGFVSAWSDNDIEALVMRALGALKHGGQQGATYARSAFSRTDQNAWQKTKAKVEEIASPDNINTLIYNYQDKYRDLKNVQQHIKDMGGMVTDLNDAYLGEETYHSKVMKKSKDFLESEMKPLLQQLFDNQISKDDFEQFLHARHAPERNAEMAKRNPNQAMIDTGKQKAEADVKALGVQLQRAQAQGLATKAIDDALEIARAERAKWNGAQAFKGTEDERLSLSGLSDAAAAQIIASVPASKRQHYDAAAARVDAINAKTLELQLQAGLIDKATFDAVKKAYQHYVPLHRDEAHPDSAGHSIGQGFSVKGSGLKRATGSNEKVTNILGHIAMKREAEITRAEKNSVAKRLYLLAMQNPLKDFWSVDKPPMIATVDPDTGFVRRMVDPLYKQKPNVLIVRIGGKDAAIVFNERNQEAVRLAGALKNLDGQDLDVVEKTVAHVTRWIASVNTQYNPIFGLINLMRDAQGAALNLSSTPLSGKAAAVMKESARLFKAVAKAGFRLDKLPAADRATWEDFQSAGGATGYRDMFFNPEERTKALEKELSAMDRGQASKAWHATVQWLSDYNEAMENVVRIAAYKTGLQEGMSKERAASLAKNLTVNFNRKGAKAQKLGAFYAFFNASVQGSARLAEALSGPMGRKIIAGGIALGVMQQMLGMLVMGGDDDDEWDNVQDFIKERALIIPTSSNTYVAIPMPLGFNVLPNIGRLFAEWATGGKDKPTGKQLAKLMNIVISAFNPWGGNDLVDTVSPTATDPVIALLRNKDNNGKQIYREDMNGNDPTPGFTRTKDSATPWAKGIAYAINRITGGTDYQPGAVSWTPDQIDYAIGVATGGVGREASKLAQTMAAPFSGDELPMHKVPLLGRLAGSTAGVSGQSDQFYQNIKALNGLEREIKGRIKAGEDVVEFIDSEPRAKLVGMGNAAERRVKRLRDAQRDMKKSGDTDGAKRVDDMVAEAMKRLNREMKAAIQ